MSNTTNSTEGQVRKAIVNGRKLARREFARVLRLVYRAQQIENDSCGVYGPALVVHEFPYGSREAKAISGMAGYNAFDRLVTNWDDDRRIVVVSR